MSLNLENLDGLTRQLMVGEISEDIKSGKLYISNRLNATGRSLWADLLRQASEGYDIAWLASNLRSQKCMEATEQRRKAKGGFTEAAIPITAPDTLAEGEFNRFYIRALCLRVIQQGSGRLVVYRAKEVSSPRVESEALIGRGIDPQRTLGDLREHPGVDTSLGLPPGPNSGLSVRLVA